MLPSILEKLLALPGGLLLGTDSNVFMYDHANIFVVGGSGMPKYTFPALTALLLVTYCSIGTVLTGARFDRALKSILPC